MAVIKKPSIQEGKNAFEIAIKQCLEILMGRRVGKIKPIGNLTSTNAAGAAPTAAEHDALVVDVNTLKSKINEMLERYQD